jgi:hypothetical protein
MPAVIEMQCPGCEESLKIPAAVFGKKIKCKLCGHAFLVPDPDKGASAKPKAKPAKKVVKAIFVEEPASPPPPPEAKKTEWDEEESAAKPELIHEEDVARCPHCAQELDPPDALVCIHCGFNNRTRAKAEIKLVWQPDAMDWFMHLLPGLLVLTVGIGIIVFNILSIMNMRDWMTGSFLESDEKDLQGQTKFYVRPGAFIFLIMGFSIPVLVPCLKFAFRRLAIDYRPTERIKTEAN